MARLARVVIPGHPHHVTQRGNGRARTFVSDADYALYRDLRAAESIGRPLGDDRFLARIEKTTKRRLKAGKRGPKPKASADGAQGGLLNALSP